jgi:uncharacterized NAD(P)/FAD-binding protein YdhS
VTRSIGIIGGGAAGVLTAIHICETATQPVAVTIYEPRAQLGEGVAYSTHDPQHLLNVPADGMSAFPDQPHHFTQWAGVNGNDFVERHRYANYLRETLQSCLERTPHVALEHRCEAVTEVAPNERDANHPHVVVHTATGSHTHDAVVIATGNAAPTRPTWLPSHPRIIHDPWAEGALASIKPGDRVACIGTGLTFVDIALTLSAAGATVHGHSRHGLLPHAHATIGALPQLPHLASPRAVLRWLRQQHDWRAAIAALRPITSELWQAFDERERRQFLRHPMRYWEIHRHRMAPQVAAQLHEHLGAGNIAIHKCNIGRVDLSRRIHLHNTNGEVSVEYDWLVLCTGPSDDVPSAGGLLATLISAGAARRGHAGLGIDSDPVTGALTSADAAVHSNVFVIGTMRRGTLWETTAIPELRSQAKAIAELLSR